MIARDSFDKSRYLLENFDRALKEGWIDIYYQPLVRAANDKVCNEEALVRWDDPILGIINPDEFIPVLEAVNQIHRLDFYVLDKVLEKMKIQMNQGLYVVTHSINISQMDFYACNLVEEIDKRVEASGIKKNLIAIEIQESAVARYNEDILRQLDELKRLGYQLWVDDFADEGGCSFFFQYFQFDMIKMSRRLIEQITITDTSRVIISEFVRVALALGIEIAAKGVENQIQVDFLREIGCAKLQGFYFCRPISMEQIFDRYERGVQIGFENPDESDYYAVLSKVSLYDLSFAKLYVNKDDFNGVDGFFDTLPMALLEVNSSWMRVVRGNENFRKFITTVDSSEEDWKRVEFDDPKVKTSIIINSIKQSATDTKRYIVSDKTPQGKIAKIMVQKLVDNPVTGVSAVMFVVLSISDLDWQAQQQEVFERLKEERVTYSRIAALAGNIISIYTVDPKTHHYSVYRTDQGRKIDFGPSGDDFFEVSRRNIISRIHKDDLDEFMEVFTKQNIMMDIMENGYFTCKYRIMSKKGYIYVLLKASLIDEVDGAQLIFGVIDVDKETRKDIEFAHTLSEAEDKAMRDDLTGVKNKKAYAKAEEDLNHKVNSGKAGNFAIIVFDLNNLKDVNDTMGHQAGDAFIKKGCEIICNTFVHSPVYRVGGDEFVVIATGSDYDKLDVHMDTIEVHNKKNQKKGEVTIAAGAARSTGHELVEKVFEQADANMYLKKKRMKREMEENSNNSYMPYKYD